MEKRPGKPTTSTQTPPGRWSQKGEPPEKVGLNNSDQDLPSDPSSAEKKILGDPYEAVAHAAQNNDDFQKPQTVSEFKQEAEKAWQFWGKRLPYKKIQNGNSKEDTAERVEYLKTRMIFAEKLVRELLALKSRDWGIDYKGSEFSIARIGRVSPVNNFGEKIFRLCLSYEGRGLDVRRFLKDRNFGDPLVPERYYPDEHEIEIIRDFHDELVREAFVGTEKQSELSDDQLLERLRADFARFNTDQSKETTSDEAHSWLASIFGEAGFTPKLGDYLTSILTGPVEAKEPTTWIDRVSPTAKVQPPPSKPVVYWKDRKTGWEDRPADVDPNDPVAFIQYFYGPWLADDLPEDMRLTTTKLRTLDRGLRAAYDKAVAARKVPEDQLLPSRDDLISQRASPLDSEGRPLDRREYNRLRMAETRANQKRQR